MRSSFLLFSAFILLSQAAVAMDSLAPPLDRFFLHFELHQNDRKIEWGRTLVSNMPGAWNKGLERSYLQLRCETDANGKLKKLYSTANHFAGLRIMHEMKGDVLKLTVIRSEVTPRYAEISAMPKNECRELLPIVNTTTDRYELVLDTTLKQTRAFGKDMTLTFSMLPMAKGK